MFAYLVLGGRTGHRTLMDLCMVHAIFASLGPTLMKTDQLSANDVLQALSLLLPAAHSVHTAHRHCIHSITLTALVTIRQVRLRAHRLKTAIAARDLFVTTFDACPVLEDRTGTRILLDLHLVHALSVYLGPSLMKKDRLSANDVLQALSLPVPTAHTALSVPRHRIQSTASTALIPSRRQALRHVDSQRLLLLLLQWYSFARADL